MFGFCGLLGGGGGDRLDATGVAVLGCETGLDSSYPYLWGSGVGKYGCPLSLDSWEGWFLANFTVIVTA